MKSLSKKILGLFVLMMLIGIFNSCSIDSRLEERAWFGQVTGGDTICMASCTFHEDHTGDLMVIVKDRYSDRDISSYFYEFTWKTHDDQVNLAGNYCQTHKGMDYSKNFFNVNFVAFPTFLL